MSTASSGSYQAMYSTLSWSTPVPVNRNHTAQMRGGTNLLKDGQTFC